MGLCVLALLFLSASCAREQAPEPPPPAEPKEDALARVGSLTIYQTDLDHHLAEKYSGRTDVQTREVALRDLVRRARFAQAGLDAGLARDPVVRAEMARLLEARLREQQLYPRIKALADIPEARLREIYEEEGARFQSPEKRQVAVLWLNPGRDPTRKQTYVDKLTQAREWLLNDDDLAHHPRERVFDLGC